jgi:ankyrin repeat protein
MSQERLFDPPPEVREVWEQIYGRVEDGESASALLRVDRFMWTKVRNSPVGVALRLLTEHGGDVGAAAAAALRGAAAFSALAGERAMRALFDALMATRGGGIEQRLAPGALMADAALAAVESGVPPADLLRQVLERFWEPFDVAQIRAAGRPHPLARALVEASRRLSPQHVAALLDAGADADAEAAAPLRCETPLQAALCAVTDKSHGRDELDDAGFAAVLELLLRAGADPAHQRTMPLVVAAHCGYSLALLRRLLRHVREARGDAGVAAAINTTSGDHDSFRYGHNALTAAALRRGELGAAMVGALLEAAPAGAVQVDVAGPQGRAALHEAANASNAASVGRLLRAGADVHVHDHFSDTPLHMAGDASVAELLLRAGADIGRLNYCGCTPLLSCLDSARFAEQPALVRTLLAAGADASFCSAHGETALHHAVHPEAARLLLEADPPAPVDVDASGAGRWGRVCGTPLLHAVRRCRTDSRQLDVAHDVVSVLLRHGADIRATCDDVDDQQPFYDCGNNVLHLAAITFRHAPFRREGVAALLTTLLEAADRAGVKAALLRGRTTHRGQTPRMVAEDWYEPPRNQTPDDELLQMLAEAPPEP